MRTTARKRASVLAVSLDTLHGLREKELEAATTRSEVNAAAKKLMLAKAELRGERRRTSCKSACNVDPLMECAPGAGQIQAAVLTICRAWLSSNWAGLR
jgi:hypothetical protein